MLFFNLFFNKINTIILFYFHTKIKNCWKCTHPQGIQDIYEFVSSSEHV